MSKELINKIVYLSGPITGLHLDNRPLFEHYKQIALDAGAKEVVVPHELFDRIDTTEYRWENYMHECLIYVLKAEVILFLPQWQMSKGALLEADVAMGCGIKRVTYRELEIPIEKETPKILPASI